MFPSHDRQAISFSNKKDGDNITHGLNGRVFLVKYIDENGVTVDGISLEYVNATTVKLRTSGLTEQLISGYLVVEKYANAITTTTTSATTAI